MRLRLLLPFVLAVAAFLAPLLLGGPAAGEDFKEGEHNPDSEYMQRRKPGKCRCHTGQASWQYLRTPMRPPADPPVCGLIRSGGDCKTRPRPKGVSGMCWGSQKKECFWKRHAYSYRMHCSECWKDDECTLCDKLIGKPDPKIKATLERQLQVERLSKKDKAYLVIAYSRHFYVVTDIHRRLKVLTEGGAPRVATAHEVAHLYLERCERAYDDFVHWFGGDVKLSKPMGVYLMAKKRRAEEYALRYLGARNTDLIRGASSDSRIAAGFCGNGFVGSLAESRSDVGLHAYCRHMIGHSLFSCWLKVAPMEQNCPVWADIASAHFLEKLLEPHEDEAHYCSNETTAPSGSGKDWHKKARGLAGRRLDPIETFFGRNSSGQMKYVDHIRAWSLMDLCLREDRDRWLKVLTFLRWGDDEGPALREAMGLTSDQFNERWKDRLRGKRRTMAETKKDARSDPDEPGRKEREAIRTTQEAAVLAGRIRGVHQIDDIRLAKAIVGRLNHESDLVREAIQIVLERVKNKDVLEWLTNEALHDKDKFVRAGVARALGALKHKPAREILERQLDDAFWLARANAAWALSKIGDPRSLTLLRLALEEKQDKCWIAIADACASFAGRNDDATLLTVPRISDPAWQVRVTACRALSKYGTDKCLDALIKRFAMERGRLEKELREALKAVTNDDLGPRAATWAKWWAREKAKHGGLDPNPPPKPKNPAGTRYADPGRSKDDSHYYGRRIYSRAVGFVFDTSSSMDKNITIPEGAATKLGKIPTSGTRMQVAKQVLAGAIMKLPSQTRFNLTFFSSDVRPWRGNLIVASEGNRKAAANAVMAAPSSGETNIHGALKAALGLHKKPTLSAALLNIPDTVYFLTDGSPTRGEIQATPELLGWFRDINRFAKVKLHVVAFGNLGVNIEFLRGLAAAGGGDFIHVPER